MQQAACQWPATHRISRRGQLKEGQNPDPNSQYICTFNVLRIYVDAFQYKYHNTLRVDKEWNANSKASSR
jgi:hypothetical protein